MPRKSNFVNKPDLSAVAQAAAEAGFTRDVAPQTPEAAPAAPERAEAVPAPKAEVQPAAPVDDIVIPRRAAKKQRTGRDRQLNVKVRAQTILDLHRIADENEWGLGEALEHLIDHWRHRKG